MHVEDTAAGRQRGIYLVFQGGQQPGQFVERDGVARVQADRGVEIGHGAIDQAQLLQAHGALAIVGLDGITEFADAIEQLLATLGDATVPDNGAAIAAAQNGFAALRGYLDDLIAGHPDQPLKLFAPYRAMIVARV